MPGVPSTWETKVRISWSEASCCWPRQNQETLSKQQTKTYQRTEDMDQVVECLSTKHEALSSVHSTAKSALDLKCDLIIPIQKYQIVY
jgi:hypothetical protein